MATIYIDNAPYTVKDGQNLLSACLSLGFDVPYFCWHPALGSVGACRQCAVKVFKDENDARGRIVMSCMTPVADGMRLSIDDPEAKKFRAQVIECLMTNHPLDCPVCDEGGECHLQDMTLMSGHKNRRFRFPKRTYNNQDLGPFVNHEMNRCIQCYRCVRFYRDYAGGRDLNVFGCHNHVYFGRHQDGTLESEFSGNLVEICPTGVFTDKTFQKHYTRPWDLQTAPSVCIHCGLGCNITPGERYGELRRIRNRYNGEVNGYFLCDRGRYGYEFVNAETRIRNASKNNEPLTGPTAFSTLAAMLSDRSRVIGIGSPRASLESNFALRTLVGAGNFFTGLADRQNQLLQTVVKTLQDGPVPSVSLKGVGECDAVFVLGEDVSNTAPLVALRLRQSVRIQPMAISRKLKIPDWDENPVREAVQNERGPLFVAATHSTGLDSIAKQTYTAAPDDLARLGFAVAHAIDPSAPAVPGLPANVADLANAIAQALQTAAKPLVVSGASTGSKRVLYAASQIAKALHARGCKPGLFFTAPECNSIGTALMGGDSLEEAQRRLASGMADTVVIVENDLYRRADKALIDSILNLAKTVIVIEHTPSDTTSKADVILPAATFADGDGTFVNNEGRAQRQFQVFMPNGETTESWRWLAGIMHALGLPEGDEWNTIDDVQASLAKALPVFDGVSRVAPRADARFGGQRVPRQPLRYSARSAMRAHINVSEPGIPNDPDSPLTFSMEGYRGAVPSSVQPMWAPGWNSVQNVTKFQQESGGPLRGGDPGVRLIEPAGKDVSYWQEIPPEYQPPPGECLAVPIHHIFGSGELSVKTRAITQRIAAPYVAMNPNDADALGVKSGDTASLTIGATACDLPVQLRPALPRGVVGVPAGYQGLAHLQLPATAKLARRATI